MTGGAQADDPLFAGGGELGRVMAARDWTATPVGSPETWPAGLRSVVRILLTSRFSMWMAWGPELTVFYNDAYQRDTLQAKHPWALGRPAREVWAEIWPDIGPRIRSVLDTGEATWDDSLRLFLERRGYAEETYHTFSYSPLGERPDRVDGMLCVVTETTERVLGERRLRVLSELGDISAVTAPTVPEACAGALAVLERGRLDIPAAAIYLTGDDGTVRRLGSYGMRDVAAVVPVEVGRDDAWPFRAVLAAGGACVVTGAPDGRPGWSRPLDVGGPPGAVVGTVVGFPIASGAGSDPLGVLVAGVSPYRALDAEYRRFLDLVARQVSTAVADAAAFQAQRRRADELEELDRAKTEFFTGVSHELRTPLTLISAPAADSLADRANPLPPAQRPRVELIARNSGRLRRLVDTLLDFARLEGGRLTPDRVPVDLAALTRGIVESFAPAVTRAGLGLVLDCPALPSAVVVDVSMWEKIVLNLLSNAVKYTHAGRVTITLAAEPGGGVRLSVSDTGIGVVANEQPLLFRRFHRVRGTTGRGHEGSGIGLALVAELTALHGGAVAVASTPGAGSTFTVTLPDDALTGAPPTEGHLTTAARFLRDEALRWSSTDPEVRSPVEPANRTIINAGPTVGATVLVAEDNADLRGFLADLLAPQYSVLLAADGTEALRMARAALPDLVLADVMMPGLTGIELLAGLRAEAATATIPVIMLSARAGEEASAEGLAAGADDYLVKPFSSHDLLARVRSNLELARLRSHEAQWRSVMIDALQDGFYVLDERTAAIVEINPAMTELIGLRREDLPCGPPYPHHPTEDEDPEELRMLTEAYAEAMATDSGNVVVPLRHIRTRERVWVSIAYSSMPGRTAGNKLFIATMSDITAQRRRADRDALLAETGRLLGEPTELGDRLDRFVALTAPVLGDLAVLAVPTPDGKLVPVAAAHRTDPALAELALRRPAHPLAPGHAEHYRSGTAFVVGPVDEDFLREISTDDKDLAARRKLGLRTILIAPLVVDGRLLGSLALGSTARAGRHLPADLALAEELGRRLAGVLNAERIAVRERRLQSVTAALASASTLAEAAAALATGIRDALDASAVQVFATQGDGLRAIHETDGPFTTSAVRPDDTSPVAEAARTFRAVWLTDRVARELRYPPTPDDGEWKGTEAEAVLPLISGGIVVGVVALGFGTPRTFLADEREFAMTLAGQAGQAFERAALADQRWRLAQTLQQALLPAALPRLERLVLAARYLPAVQNTRAGGDWYDVIVLDDEHVALAVGDVVGQGPAAAAVMGQLRSVLSSHLLDGHPPAAALERLDRFAGRIPGARGSTAICTVLDTTTGELRWAAAGHLPPLLVGSSGATFLTGGEGTLLGLPGRPPYREASTTMSPGAGLLLYTDGLVERRDEVVDDGLARLAAIARRNSTLAPDALAHIVLGETLDVTAAADDIALVVARLLPAPLDLRLPAHSSVLANLRHTVAEWAAEAGLPDEVAEDLQLTVDEAATNVVEHAYPDDTGELCCRLRRTADGGVDVEVRDSGRWRTPDPDPGYRGRGLSVISSLTENMQLIRADTGTAVTFHVPATPQVM